MTSLSSRLFALIPMINNENKAIRTYLSGSPTGDVSSLSTSSTNIVEAINEVKSLSDTKVSIDDTNTSSGSTWSSTKINQEISYAVGNVVSSAPGALDTLDELAAALGDDANFASTVTTSLAGKANADSVYTRTEIGDLSVDLVNLWENS